mmetsp:Transcript_78643/g.254764  ORF Transcript_78643/g.254764 Transcript_78643/m.254764 type:complete len:209 (-) Transcript_78643:1401-2027(-)
MMSHTLTCRSSPPEARKRESGDQAKHLTPAVQSSSEAFSKSRSTSSVAIMRFSPPTASSLPVGENAVAWTMSSKRMEPRYLQLSPSDETRHMTVFISWFSATFFVMRPCMSSVPPPPASMPPSGEKEMLCTWPSCRRSAISSMSGTEISMTHLALVPTAMRFFGLDVRASVRASPSTVLCPASCLVAVLQTRTLEVTSTAATNSPLGL